MSSRNDADADLAVFAQLSQEIQLQYVNPDASAWAASPFGWIKAEPSRRVGAIGERLVEAWALHEGLQVSRPMNSGHDRIVAGVKVEVKFSTLWNGGDFVFQQIRDQDYLVAALLGIEPLRAHLWFVPKPVLFANSVGQHSGASAQETRWLRFAAADPPSWLAQFGGTLARARGALEEARRSA